MRSASYHPQQRPYGREQRGRVPAMPSAEEHSRSGARREPSFNGVKVFSATMFADRDRLGDRVTEWIAANSHLKVTEMIVTQSSDAAFHCVAITVFYAEQLRR